MGESHHHHQTQATPTSSRLGIRGVAGAGGGEIVEVQGGHIVRSTGRKDRHSKVCTAKGPRDRRVRLSAHTAIQFYDVQDRLGYDRPSKAVDWLIKKAKAAIDELDELPPWHPIISCSTTNPAAALNEAAPAVDAANIASTSRRTSSSVAAMVGDGRVSDCSGGLNLQNQMVDNPNNGGGGGGSGFLPPSLDSDAIADTIKSFFPDQPHSHHHQHQHHHHPQPPSTIQFHQSYPPDLLSRTSGQSQDLRLSLQSFQDPMLLHHQAQAHHNEQTLFTGTGFIGSSSGGWSDQPHQRILAWNGGGDTTTAAAVSTTTTGNGGNDGESVGFIFNSLPSPSPLQPFFGRNQFFTQRGPLQSSSTPSVRALIDPSSLSMADHQISHAFHHQQSSMSAMGMGFISGGGFSSGFRIPARIQGEEEHDGMSEKPSSASSDSRH